MPARNMINLIFTVIAVISHSVHGSLQITDHEFPLMHYTKLISEEHFTPGRPLVVVLPLAEEVSSNKEVGYLIKELHTSDRWPILVYNVSYNVNGIMYTEILQHGSYIILISETCALWEYRIPSFWQQLYELSVDTSTGLSWNPRAKFIVPVMSNCTQFDNTYISKLILEHLWLHEVMNATVLFLKSNELTVKDLQHNTTDSAQGPYVELHTGNPYEHSNRCSAAKGTVGVKVFTVRNLRDIRKSEIFRGYFDKNFYGCPIHVHIGELPLPVYSTRQNWYNNSKHQYFYFEERDFELVRVIGKALNMSPHNVRHLGGKDMEHLKDIPIIFVGINPRIYHTFAISMEYTHSYLPIGLLWYTPCAVKYQRWSRFFNIFSVNMWICFALSLVLAVITASCISNCGHKIHLHESNSYSNIFSVTTNIIAVSLSLSVNTQPRSAPLRLFFFCWVCYSVEISTVFQAYFTTFLVEPGYVEPIKTVEQMLASDMKFGFSEDFESFFNDTSDSTGSTILKNAVRCPTRDICFKWANDYQNFSTILSDFDKILWHAAGIWTYENDRPISCEIEYSGVETSGDALFVSKGSPLLE